MNDLTTQQANELVAKDDFMGAASASDFETPRLVLMQKMSELVEAGKAKPGDMVDSLTEELLGDCEKPISIIPIGLAKTWFRSEIVKGQKEFWKIEKFVDNPTLPREGIASTEEDGITRSFMCVNDLAMLWTVVLPEQIKRDEVLPYLLTFRGASYHAGKKLVTLIAKKSTMAKKKPYEYVYRLSSVKESNDKGTFYTFSVAQERCATKDETQVAISWLLKLRGGV